jgi:phosphoserine phosphatase
MYPRIVFMDLEGTLLQKAIHLDNGKVAPSAWTLLAEYLGPDALDEEEATKDRWVSGGYGKNYIAWMQDTIRIHQQYRLTRTIFEEVIASVQEMPGARDTIKTFRERAAITVIISGGFKALADRIQQAFKIDHALSGCEYFFDPKTNLLDHWNLLPSDFTGKIDFMRFIMKAYRVRARECAFIGDGDNDVPMAEKVGLSIAFNAHPKLREVCTHVIDQPQDEENFHAVAEYLDRYRIRRPLRG